MPDSPEGSIPEQDATTAAHKVGDHGGEKPQVGSNPDNHVRIMGVDMVGTVGSSKVDATPEGSKSDSGVPVKAAETGGDSVAVETARSRRVLTEAELEDPRIRRNIPQFKMLEVSPSDVEVSGKGTEPKAELSDDERVAEGVDANQGDTQAAEIEAAEAEESLAERCGEAINSKLGRYHADDDLKKKIKDNPLDPTMEGIVVRAQKPFRDPFTGVFFAHGSTDEVYRGKNGDDRWIYFRNDFSLPADNGMGGATNMRTDVVLLEKNGTNLKYSRIRDGRTTKEIDYATAGEEDKAIVDSHMESLLPLVA